MPPKKAARPPKAGGPPKKRAAESDFEQMEKAAFRAERPRKDDGGRARSRSPMPKEGEKKRRPEEGERRRRPEEGEKRRAPEDGERKRRPPEDGERRRRPPEESERQRAPEDGERRRRPPDDGDSRTRSKSPRPAEGSEDAEEDQRRKKEAYLRKKEEERRRQEEEMAVEKRRKDKEEDERRRQEEEQRKRVAVKVVSADQVKGERSRGDGKEIDEEEEEDEEGYGEDDFDNYEDDDFADEAEAAEAAGKVEALQAELERENQRANLGAATRRSARNSPSPRASPRPGSGRAITPSYDNNKKSSSRQLSSAPPPPPKRRIMNPMEREYAQKKDARAALILKQVTMTMESFDLLELHPVSKIERFTRERGLGKVRSIASQYNEDWVSQASQTLTAQTNSTGTMFPDSEGSGSNVDGSSARLIKFVRATAQVMESLCLENLSAAGVEDGDNSQSVPASFGSISTRAALLQLPPALGRRRVIDMDFSEGRSSIMLVAYGPDDSDEGATAGQGLLCLWDLAHPEKPDKVLVCAGRPSCCALSPGRGHIAFAGLEEGSLVIYDLREGASLHPAASDATGGYCLRAASFSTDCFGAENHETRVQRVIPIKSAGASDSAFDMLSAGANSTFQMLSLDERGGAAVWTLIELKDAHLGTAHADTELGLGIGSRVKLSKSADVQSAGIGACFDLKLTPGDSNEYLVATAAGTINRRKRYGQPPQPSAYRPPLGTLTDPCTSVACAPFAPGYFLAGFASGSVCLFNQLTADPVAAWLHVCDGAVVRICWSPFRPAVFAVLDTDGHLDLWDLLKSDQAPSQRVTLEGAGADPSCLVMSCVVATDKLMASMLAVPGGDREGDVQVVWLNKSLSEPQEEEAEALMELLLHMH